MSLADEYFNETCRKILDHGTSTEGCNVRAKWADGTAAYTKKIFGVVNRYDLRQEFPVTTSRRTAIKSASKELVEWIMKLKSNNVKDLGDLHIWDQWADETGSIGNAYGYQIGKVNRFKEIQLKDSEEEMERCNFLRLPSARIETYNGKTYLMLDQMDAVLYQLKYEPFSRRIRTSMWNVAELTDMHLQPCAHSFDYCVTVDENGRYVLNGMLTQRSQDMLAANSWNTAQYAILLMVVAQCTGMIAGEFIHVINDCHIYDKHFDMVEELINRETYPAPTVKLNPKLTYFYDFTSDDVIVENYQHGEQIKNIPIAE